MKPLLESLRGKKTYGVVVIALAYLAGVKLGWWPFDENVLAAFGVTGLATLRSAIGSAAALTPPPDKPAP